MSLSALNVVKLFVPWIVKVVYKCELLVAEVIVVVVVNLWLRINRCRKLSVDDVDFFKPHRALAMLRYIHSCSASFSFSWDSGELIQARQNNRDTQETRRLFFEIKLTLSRWKMCLWCDLRNVKTTRTTSLKWLHRRSYFTDNQYKFPGNVAFIM